MSENKDNQGHSAYSVWLIYTFRAIEKILPALKGKSKYGWVPPVLLCILVLVTSVGVGIYVDGYGIHPPAQYTGVCAPPAHVTGGGQNCYQTITITVVQSGTTSTTTRDITTGSIILPNSTRGH